MIFWQLFYTFLRIGIFSFGGGLAMIALIQNEVVVKQHWLTAQEFTDVVATSQINIRLHRQNGQQVHVKQLSQLSGTEWLDPRCP